MEATMRGTGQSATPVSASLDVSPNSNPLKPAARFAFVDGLRGIAALSIVIFHIWWYEPAPRAAYRATHWIVDETLLRTKGGVQILLVISGFVIAYTLRKTWFSIAEVNSFLIRRLVRLVPAYWVALGVVIVLDYLCRNAWDLPPPFEGGVSFLRTTAHMAFLQDVFAQEALSAGVWTLCIEMQFYIVAIFGWGIAQRFFERPNPSEPSPSIWGLIFVFAPSAFISLLHWRTLDSTDPWVIHFLWMFFLGMITWWTLDRTLPHELFVFVVAIASVELLFDAEWRYLNAVALCTALAIYIAGRFDKLSVWLNWSPLQYLGRISYSLYLIHFPVCHLLTEAGWKWFSYSPTSLQAGAILMSAVPASVLAGQVLYSFVEAPSAAWAAKLKSSQKTKHDPAPLTTAQSAPR